MILSRNSEIFPTLGMSKVDEQKKEKGLKREGYISSICFLMIFSVGFFLVWSTIELMKETYLEKLMEFQALKNLTVYDLRSDIYSVLNQSTHTFVSFDEEVYLNGNRIFLDENKQIYIERGE